MRNVPVYIICKGVKLAVCLLLVLLLCNSMTAKAQEATLVLFLNSQESEQSTKVIAGFKKQMSRSLPQAEYISHLVDTQAELNPAQFVSKNTKSPPAVIIALGTKATKIAQASFTGTPILATLILDGNIMESKKNRAAILLSFPFDIQLQWLLRFMPQAQRIGILYDPAISTSLVKEAENAAKGKNIKIVSYGISSPKDLQAGLKQISSKADVLLAVTDQTVYSGKTAKEILLFSYRNRIPFGGLSSFWVKAGALYALEVDYGDLGRQAAELAENLIIGKSLDKGPIFYPDKVSYSLNIRTKDHLRLDISRDLIKGASITFE